MTTHDPVNSGTPSFLELLAMIPQDGLSAIRIANKKALAARQTARDEHYEALGVSYGYALYLRERPLKYAVFKQQSIWADRTYALKEEDVLRQVIMEGRGVISGPQAGLACTDANSLLPWFDAVPPVPAADIPNFIKQSGGMGKLLKKYRAERKGLNEHPASDKPDPEDLDEIEAEYEGFDVYSEAETDDALPQAGAIGGQRSIPKLVNAFGAEATQSEPPYNPASGYRPQIDEGEVNSASPSGHKAIPPSKPKEPRQPKYAESTKGWTIVQILLRPRDGHAATDRRTGRFMLECDQVANGDLDWIRIEAKIV